MKLIYLCLIMLATQCTRSSKSTSTASYSTGELPSHLDIAFYNVENLFDTIDDRGKKDEDFTPNGRNEWNEGRYEKKLQQLSRVIQAMDHGDGLPAIIGLAEVENEDVVRDLANTILPNGYGVITENSADRRGIDVALLYRKDLIDIIDHDALRISFNDRNYTSRDILHVELSVASTERIHVFVNHWPSRREGQQESEHRRLSAAETLREAIDDIQVDSPDAQIIVLGDFNDYPDNKSLTQVLRAKTKDGRKDGELINLAFELHTDDEGTYPYKGDWGMLDQAIVSDALLVEQGLYLKMDALEIFREEFMMYYDKKYKEYKPNRTYGGPRYYGGYSDHLPILIHLNSTN